MHIKIKYDGEICEFPAATDMTAQELADFIYKGVSLDKIQLKLKDGTFLILGKEAVSRATFLVVP